MARVLAPVGEDAAHAALAAHPRPRRIVEGTDVLECPRHAALIADGAEGAYRVARVEVDEGGIERADDVGDVRHERADISPSRLRRSIAARDL
jgi:hypothetical protein